MNAHSKVCVKKNKKHENIFFSDLIYAEIYVKSNGSNILSCNCMLMVVMPITKSSFPYDTHNMYSVSKTTYLKKTDDFSELICAAANK